MASEGDGVAGAGGTGKPLRPVSGGEVSKKVSLFTELAAELSASTAVMGSSPG